MKKLFAIFIGLLLMMGVVPDVSAQLPDVCQEPENIMPNCTFDNGLDGWQTFTEAGGADISVLQGGGECHAPLCPAAYIVTKDHFVGGLYQQVPVTPGNTYYANIIWLVFDSLANDGSINSQVGGIGRRIGIDPSGGTDSRSPNVVWSEDNWRNDCKICGIEEVAATAQAETITVFLRIDTTWRLRAAEKGFAVPPSKDQFWIDDIGLKQISEDEAAAVTTETEPTAEPTAPPPPTDTPAPETVSNPEAVTANSVEAEEAEAPAEVEEAVTTEVETEENLEPTESEAVEDTDASDEAAVAETAEAVLAQVTETPPAPVNTVAAPPTLTPTATRTPAPAATPVAAQLTGSDAAPATRRQQAVADTKIETEPDSESLAASLIPTSPSVEFIGLAGSLACVGGVFVIIMAVVLAAMAWLYRLGWGNVKDDLDDDEADDVEVIDVEIIE